MVALAEAWVRIRPSTDGFKQEAERGINADQLGKQAGRAFSASFNKHIGPALRKSSAGLGATAAEAFAKSFQDRVKDETGKTPVGPSTSKSRKQGEESGGGFADGFRKRIDAAVKALPPINIGVARDEAEQHLRDLQVQLKELSGKRIGVDIDTGQATAAAERLREQLGDLVRNSPSIQVRADAGEAAAQLKVISDQVSALGRQTADVKVDVDSSAASRLSGIGSSADGSRASLAALAVAGVALGPAIIPAAAAAAAALAALGPAAVAGVAGIGVGVLAFQGIGEAVSAMGAAQKDAAKSSASYAGAQNAVANAMDGVRSALASQVNAQASVGEAARRAALQVADAERSVGEARRDAAQVSEDAVRRVVDAQRAHADAERDAVRVRRELTDAQRDARQAMEDLDSTVKSNALAQKQANLDVADAKKRLDAVLANPKASKDQRAQAQINYEREVLQQDDLKRRAQRLAAEQADALKKGVNGSDQVVAARERIRAADERSAAAQRAVAEAQKQAVRTRLDGEGRVTAAIRSLGEARNAQQQQERQGAFQLAQAAQSVVSAQRAVQQASMSAGLAGGAAMSKLKEAMDGLSPAGQKFAAFIFGLKDEFKGLQGAAAAGLLPGVQKAIETLLPYLPAFQGFVSKIATAMGDLAVKAAQALTSPFWVSFFKMIGDTAVPALKGMFAAAGNVVEGFAAIILAFAPLSKDVGTGIVDLTKKFADWAKSLTTSAGFQEFLDYVRTNGPVVGKLLGDIATVIGRLVVGLAPLGAITLGGLSAAVGVLAKLSPTTLAGVAVALGSIAGALGVYTLAVKAAAVGTKLWKIATVAASAAQAVWTGVVWLFNAALAANPIGIAVIAIAALVAAIVIAYNKSETFRVIVQKAWAGIQVAVSHAWHNVIKPALAALVDFFTTKVAPAALWLWNNVLKPAFAGIGAAIAFAWNNVIKPAVTGLVFFFQKVIAPVVLWLWRNVITPAWRGIQLAISIAWAAIKVIFGLIQIYIKAVLAPVFLFLWNNVIKPVWGGIKATISGVWENGIKPIFNALGGFIGKYVVPAFKAGVGALGKAWAAIKDVAKAPVKFVVETVLNNGILAGYNKIAKLFNVKPDNVQIPLPKGFATGGILPGYTPGKDVHRFVSPTGGVLDLSGGEPVLRPEVGKVVGKGWVDGVNHAARSGGTGGVKRFLGGFARGGIVGSGDGIGDLFRAARKKASDVITGAKDLLRDPAGALNRLADRLVSLVPGKDTSMGKLVTGLPRKASKILTDKLNVLTDAGSSIGSVVGSTLSKLSPFGGSAGMMGALRGSFPGLRLISGFRPGSTTLSGNTSYHSSDRAVDVPPNRDVAEYIFRNFRKVTKELITPYQEFNLLNGRPHRFTGAVWNQHNFAGGNAHDHWAAKLGGIFPGIRSYDSGGAWPSGTVGVNTSGRTEHVTTGAGMDAQLDRLDRLIEAVERVAPGVGEALNGGMRGARQLARAR